MIGITPEVEGAAVVVYTIVGADGQAAHALQRVVNGEPPSRTEGDLAEYAFGNVGVYLFPER